MTEELPTDVWETNPILKRMGEVVTFRMLYPTHQQYVSIRKKKMMENRNKRLGITGEQK